jgi:ATP-dependent RNA helicase DeaD
MDSSEENNDSAEGFDAFGLDARIVKAVEALGFEVPTPIQTEAIPALLKGSNVIGGARTGSGKTAAFGLPLLHNVRDGGPVRGLVLCPTRELAIQVHDALQSYAKQLRLRITCIYGGTSYEPQFRALKAGATVIVATPGRLLDHLDRGSLDLSGLEVLVLDEADEMLKMGFIDDVKAVLAASPDDRQVALFSATLPAAIRDVIKRHVPDPVQVQVESRALSVDHIDQFGVKVPQRRKMDALVRILMGETRGATLIFARTRRGCADIADTLAKRGVAAEALHGDLNQSARERVIHRLRAGRLNVVVATDVAARGIDVEHITHVINYDLPMDREIYVHRIGRTGRAGRKGKAISLVTPAESRRVRYLEQDLKVRIEIMQVPSNADIAARQRANLLERLKAVDLGDEAGVREWLTEITSDEENNLEDLTVAAIALLARDQGAKIKVAAETRDSDWQERSSAPRSDGDFKSVNEVELFVATGSQWGVRAGDIVGAIANETGIEGRQIGRITILDRKSFVGLPQTIAEKIVTDFDTLEIRGVPVKLSLARPREQDNRSDRRGGGRPYRNKQAARGGHRNFNAPWKNRKRRAERQ